MFSFIGRKSGLYIRCVALFGLALSTTAFSDARVPLSLAEAERLALENEPGHRELIERAAALDEQATAAAQLPDPTLRLGIANFPISSGGFSTEGMTQAQVALRQAFPRRGVRKATEESFRAMADASRSAASSRDLDVREAVRHAWLEVYYWQQVGEILEESRAYFSDLASVTESQYAVGRSSQQDLLRAELELTRIDDRMIAVAQSRAMAQGRLSEWLGDDAFRRAAPVLPDWEQLPLLPALRESIAGHPAMAAARASVAASDARVTQAQQQKKPGWAIDVGYGYRDGVLPNGEPRSDMISVNLVVDLPVFSKNRQDRSLAAALNDRSSARSASERVAASLESKLRAEYARWTDLTRRLALYETRLLSLSEQQAGAALRAYESDAGDFTDVARSFVDALNARIQHLEIQVERAKSFATLASLARVAP